MVDLQQRIEKLTPDQRRRLAERLGRAPDTAPPPDNGAVPASFAQRRLWFLDRYYPEDATYNNAYVLRLRGPLVVPALRQSLKSVVDRHESLRTAFDEVDGEPLLRIAPAAPVEWFDFQTTEARSEDQIDDLARADAMGPFDLREAPPWRLRLIRLADADHALVFVVHHIVFDRWSLSVFREELLAFYEAAVADRPGPALPQPAPYHAYARAQARRYQRGDFEADVAYWQERLGDRPAELALPTDQPRPTALTTRGGQVRAAWDAELAAALRRFADRHNATEYMVMLAAFAVLLSRYARQREMVIGVPVAGRSRAELERVIGLFVNMLPVRVDVEPTEPFGALLARVRGSMAGALAHAEAPFEALVERIGGGRDPSRQPLVQAVLNMHNTPGRQPSEAGLSIEVHTVRTPTARFELSITAQRHSGAMRLEYEYNRDLFAPSTVGRMAEHLQTLLKGVIADPGQAVGEVPLIDAQERRALAGFANGGDATIPAGSLASLFETQADRTPDAAAVSDLREHLTYHQLERRSNQLAHHLRSLGVERGDLVGVCLPRTVDLPMAMLSVMKAGAAYVPLRPDDPPARVAELLRDCEARWLISASGVRAAERWPPEHRVTLDQDAAAISRSPVDRPAASAGPDDLAYVIHTSGSTGHPKGVAVEHRSAVALIGWFVQRFGDSLECVLFATSASFDIALAEWLAPLTVGGRVLVVENLLEWARHPGGDAATYVQAVPSVLRRLLDGGKLPASMRTVTMTGETVPNALAQACYARGAQAVWNLYGPTETTVWSTAWQVPRGSAANLPIGRPLPGEWVYILERPGQPAPIGVPGELCIGGIGVARGYVNRPDLTAERFVRDPFRDGSAARMYRTGDLARFRPDGVIEYLGRLDGQVKIRGFRIEPGEIEGALAEHPGVSACAVRLGASGGEPELVAFVCGRAGRSVAASDLRRHLADRLPRHMIPARFVTIDAMPLTPSGKADRRALVVPADVSGPCRSFRPAGSDVERLVAETWREVLCVDRIGADDDFFELGGHSLRATEAARRLEQALGIEVSLPDLFRFTTVATLAAWLEGQRGAQAKQHPLIADEADVDGQELTPSERRLWFLDYFGDAVSRTAYHVAVATRLRGPVDVPRLREAVEAVTARHPALRTVFPHRDGRPYREVRTGGRPAFDAIDLSSGSDADQLDQRLREAIHRRFNLGSGPLLRVSVFRTGDDQHVFLLCMHHIICDLASVVLVMDEISACYGGRLSALAEPPAPPRGRRASPEKLAQQLAFWRQRLADAPPLMELPVARRRPAVLSSRGRRYLFDLTAEAPALLRLGREERLTPFMTFLALFKVLLRRYADRADVIVGTPMSVRPAGASRKAVGFQLNTVVVRSTLPGESSFRDALRRVKSTVVEAYGHRDVPFDQVVEALGPERSASHAPLFQMLFVLRDDVPPNLDLPGITAERLDLSRLVSTAKFDLTLDVQLSGGRAACCFEYNTDLFDESSVRGLADHLRELARAAAQAPDAPIASLDFAGLSRSGEAPRRREAEPVEPLHRLFERQAAATPDAPAVSAGSDTWSYRRLNEQADRVARILTDRGVEPDEPVAVCVERSLAMASAALGIMKAGAAVMPLDPNLPPARWRRMVEIAQPRRVLTDGARAASVADLGLDALRIDRLGTGRAARAPVVAGDANHLAYVLFTSGSTGEPKGVAMPHGPLCRLVRWQARDSHCHAGSRTLQYASLGFDVAFQEMFATWAVGGGLVLCDEQTRRDFPALLSLIDRQRIDRLFLPFVALEQLAEASEAEPALGGCVREVITAGEALRITPAIRRLFARWRRAQLVNQYGPTEAHVVSRYALGGPPENWPELPPIGSPLDHVCLHVLDDQGHRVPAGLPGELHIAGSCLARGYLNRPDLTRERFVADPFDREGGRMYRTGDRVRLDHDGQLVFLGRADRQIKVRGHRVELGEIESLLRRQAGVRQAAVHVRSDRGPGRLVAYIVPEPASVPDARVWHDACRTELPAYMVPADFVVLAEMPITATGKVDYAALPPPSADVGSAISAADDQPRNLVEQELLGVFTEVLGLDRAGVNESFFDLGGHSLLVARLFVAIERTFGVALPLSDLFDAPTVRLLGARLSRKTIESARGSVVPLQPNGARPPLFCLPGIWGHVFSFRGMASRLGPDQPVFGLQYPGLNAEGQPLAHVEDIARAMTALVTEKASDGPCLLSGYSYGGVVAFEMARQLAAVGRRVPLLVVFDTSAPDSVSNRALPIHAVLHMRALITGEAGGRWAYLKSRVAGVRRRLAGRSADDLGPTGSRVADRIDAIRQANAAALRRYRPGWYDGSLTLLRAEQAGWFARFRRIEPMRGWGRHAASVREIRVPGTHDTMVKPIHADALAQVMRRCIDEALGS